MDLVINRRDGFEVVGDQRIQVTLRHAGIFFIGHDRQEFDIVAAHAFDDRIWDLLIGPTG